MPADVSLEKKYKVGSGKVFVSLIIGEGQFGRTDVRLNGVRLVRVSGSVGDLLLGKGDDIRGRTLRLRSIVHDTVSATNRMSVTYTLAGGNEDKEFIARGEVEREGGDVVFEAKFLLG
jgi:hypothetical protein